MFIRRTKTRTSESGVEYYSYRLVDTYRTGEHVRQRTLLNLGNHFSLPCEHWKPLCARIGEMLQGQTSTLLCYPDEVEREALRIVALLAKKYDGSDLILNPARTHKCNAGQASNEKDSNHPSDDGDYRSVDLHSLELMNSRNVGAEAVALQAVEQVRLDDELRALGFNRKQIHAAIGNIIGRMVQPGSERATHRYLREQSALGELIGCDYERQSLSALYRASDLLWKHHDEIESFLYRRHCELFDVEQTITLFDLTNTFFEGTGKYNDHAAYGHSKEKRDDCPLVSLALVLDGSGFSRRSRIFPGNVSEPGTLKKMIDALRAPEADEEPQGALDLSQPPTIVMDAGIASQENIDWLVAQGYPYIVVSRKRHLEFNEEKAVTVKESEDNRVRAMRVERENGEIELYCHSQLREAKESAINERGERRFLAALDYLADGLDKPRRLKNGKKVCEKIGRLRQQYPHASKNYDITTELDEQGNNAIALHYRRIEQGPDPDAHPGVYCLRSNQRDWEEERLWRTYAMLTDLEAVFRSLKSELGMRPVYHQKTHRVEGHIFITLLAYNLVHQIRLKLKNEGIDECWEGIRNTLKSQMRMTVTMRDVNGEQIFVRKSNYPDASQQKLLRALELSFNPGGTDKTVVIP